MFIDAFLQLRLQGITLASLAKSYAAWILSTDSEVGRRRRLQEGIEPTWSIEGLRQNESLVGRHGCRVDVRLTHESLIVHFTHRDTRDGAIFWHTVARARPNQRLTVDEVQDVLLEHATGRDAPPGYRLRPIAAAPRVVTQLLDDAAVTVLPRHVLLPLVTLHGGDVKGYVEHELLHDAREVPTLVISCGAGGAPPIVDPEKVSKRLRGQVPVVFLETARSTFEFAGALESHGYGREFKCFHGAAHIYGPTSDMRDDHRLWLADSLLAFPEAQRADDLAGIISGRQATQKLPGGFFTLIGEHDRQGRRGLAERLTKKASQPPPSIPSQANVAEALAERERLRVELEDALKREKEYETAWLAADDARRGAERQRETAEAQAEEERAVQADLRADIDGKKAVITNLQERLDTLKGKPTGSAPGGGLDDELLAALLAGFQGRPTPEQSLMVVRALYPERIIVHPKAINSARQSDGFLYPDRVLELLMRLAGPYWEALNSGKGDAQAKTILGNGYSPKESKTTTANKRAAELRTVVHNGRELVLWAHLKIGVKQDSDAETFRAHFEWLADERRILIGHCGPHLDLR